MAVFEEWMPLLVLRACLALGLFTEPGATSTPQQLEARIIPYYRRFTSEMTAMLQRAGVCTPSQNTLHVGARIELLVITDV